MQSISEILAQELNCKQEYIENVIALLDEGNTIPVSYTHLTLPTILRV